MNFVLILLYISGATSSALLTSTAMSFVSDYLKEHNTKYCYFFTCWSKHETIRFIETMALLNIRSSVVMESEDDIKRALTKEYLTNYDYVVDLSCNKFRNLLETMVVQQHFCNSYSWLVFAENNVSTMEYWLKKLDVDVPLRIDSVVRVLVPFHPNDNNNTDYRILDVYNPGIKIGGRSIFREYGTWSVAAGLMVTEKESFYMQRRNMTNFVIRTATVIRSNITRTLHEHLVDMRINKLDLISQYFYSIFLLLRDVHQFSYNLSLSHKWSGPEPSGISNGILKLLYEDTIDVSASGSAQSVNRLNFTAMLMPAFQFRSVYTFRNPGVYNIFTNNFIKPFSLNTWYIIISSSVIIGICLKAAFWVENEYFNLSTKYSWFTILFSVASVIFQQGSGVCPGQFAGRFIFFILLLLSIILYNYYTSCIISILLSAPSVTLKNLYELGNSNLEIGIENFDYTINWFKSSNDTAVQTIYDKMVKRSRERNIKNDFNFYSIDDGLAKVRNGGFAYHTQAELAYLIISKLFSQNEICDLKEIQMIPANGLGIPIQKESQYLELFHISLRRIRETGFVHRIKTVYVAGKPQCLSDTIVSPASKEQIFIAFLCLMFGMVLSLVLLIIEILWFNHGLHENLGHFKLSRQQQGVNTDDATLANSRSAI